MKKTTIRKKAIKKWVLPGGKVYGIADPEAMGEKKMKKIYETQITTTPVGWTCPRCGGGVAPGIDRCPCTVSVPVTLPLKPWWYIPYWYTYTTAEMDNCLLAAFFRDNPHETAAFISCSCSRCSPQF